MCFVIYRPLNNILPWITNTRSKPIGMQNKTSVWYTDWDSKEQYNHKASPNSWEGCVWWRRLFKGICCGLTWPWFKILHVKETRVKIVWLRPLKGVSKPSPVSMALTNPGDFKKLMPESVCQIKRLCIHPSYIHTYILYPLWQQSTSYPDLLLPRHLLQLM